MVTPSCFLVLFVDLAVRIGFLITVTSTTGNRTGVTIDEAKDILGKNRRSTVLGIIHTWLRAPQCCCGTQTASTRTVFFVSTLVLPAIRWRDLADCQIDPILDF